MYPFRAKLAAEGGEFVVVPRPRDATWTQGIVDAIDERTAVVIAPNCHWTDGTAVDLLAVGQAARAVGAALVIDVSQSLGVPAERARDPPGLHGVRGLQVADGSLRLRLPLGIRAAPLRIRDRVDMDRPQRPDDFNRLVDYTDELREGARRFDAGEWSNFMLLPMAAAAIDLISGWGPARVSTSLAVLTARVEEGARRLGLDPVPAAHRLPHMLGVRFPKGEPPGLRERLAAERVFVSLRANAVRVAPHLYNDASDVDRLLNVLEACCESSQWTVNRRPSDTNRQPVTGDET